MTGRIEPGLRILWRGVWHDIGNDC
jgi:hypothetical protein